MSGGIKTAEYPKLPNGEIDKESVKQQYMGSPFMDWTRFVEAQGYHPHTARREFPVKTWQDEKKAFIAEKESDRLAGMLFDRKFRWHKEVIKTLDDYPEANDMMMYLLKAKMNQMGEMYKDYVDLKKDNNLPVNKAGIRVPTPFEQITPMDLKMMSSAVKDVTDSKYRSLLLNDWNVKLAEDDSAQAIKEDGIQKGFTMKVIGKGDMSIAEIQKMMDQYLDKPSEDIIEVAAEKQLPEAKDEE